MSEPDEGPVYRVGQEVRVTYLARVAEVSTWRPGAPEEQEYIRLEPAVGVHTTGWIIPGKDSIELTITHDPLPTEPGIYWSNSEAGEQSDLGQYHTDGKAFYYLNVGGYWVDLGWGMPLEGDGLNLLTDGRPF